MAGIPTSSLNVEADAPDLRDRYYEPKLSPLKEFIHPPGNLNILNQGKEGACTGFGLAATVNLLYRFQGKNIHVSPRMLYEMARRYDEWQGEDYDGSSCRGALKGWKNTGVCLEDLAPYQSGQKNFTITDEVSRDAVQRTLGAYYRLNPQITDFHSALNESGVIYASAKVHSGWNATKEDGDGDPIIPFKADQLGGHAFAIVGYNHKGFWIQNSWGRDKWGEGGLAIWLYEDWLENIMDAWVVQMALPTPQIFGGSSSAAAGLQSQANDRAKAGTTPRYEIERHFIHFDDGRFCDRGRYWSNETQLDIVKKTMEDSGCEHFLLYAHGGLTSPKASAKRIASYKQVFLENGIYPFHFMYDTGFCEELKDVVYGRKPHAEVVSGGVRDWFDARLEFLVRRIGRVIWREMKEGARKPFSTKTSDGTLVIKELLNHAQSLDKPMKIHVVGHSAGSILQAYMVKRAFSDIPKLKIETCSLMAPAVTNKLFFDTYTKFLKTKIAQMTIYNLADQLEQDDTVGPYGKSLLYLVSKAFEKKKNTSLLGMELYKDEVSESGVEIVYSDRDSPRTNSKTHGGFDNDPATLNDILKRMLGARKFRTARKFAKKDLSF